MSDDLDLSGEWAGLYNYAAGLPPVSFRASFRERTGWITGVIEEPSAEGRGPARRLGASVQGRREGAAVTWLKLYDELSHGYDAVRYRGAVSADGEEISGRWSIVGDWSGTFLMVRQSRSAAGADRRAVAKE